MRRPVGSAIFEFYYMWITHSINTWMVVLVDTLWAGKANPEDYMIACSTMEGTSVSSCSLLGIVRLGIWYWWLGYSAATEASSALVTGSPTVGSIRSPFCHLGHFMSPISQH
jgi:hypothetical protein